MSRPELAAEQQTEKTSKSERLEARLTREQKELLQWAADLEGRSLTDFVVSALSQCHTSAGIIEQPTQSL